MKRHDAWLKEQLQDPQYAADYLAAAADDLEPGVYLHALRQIAEARGTAAVAEASGLSRERIYRALSPKGNPRWTTLSAILRATGMKLTVTRGP
jgi:probable addiction module antidote protein